MKALGRDLPKFQALGAQVIGISYDDPGTQHKFALHCAAAFPFLSDAGGKVAQKYRTAGGFGPVRFAQRRTFVVDGLGIVRAVHDGMPDHAKLFADLEAIARANR